MDQLIESKYGYDLSRTLDSIRPYYHFDESCQGTVPEAAYGIPEKIKERALSILDEPLCKVYLEFIKTDAYDMK